MIGILAAAMTNVTPAPSPTPVQVPKVDRDAVWLLIAQNLGLLGNIASLAVYFAMSLGAVYLGVALTKVVLRQGKVVGAKTLLPWVYALLVIAAGASGYRAGGSMVAIATALGAAASSLLHDWIDSKRAWRRKR